MQAQKFQTRQVMHNNTFEVFHYFDAQPSCVALHHHDFYEVYYFAGDSAEYRVEGRTYHLRHGDLLLINPMELHQPLVAPGVDYDRVVLWISKSFLDGFSGEGVDLANCFDLTRPAHVNLLRLNPKQMRRLEDALLALVRESYGESYASSVYANALFLQFMVELNRLALQPGGGAAPQHTGSELAASALRYIGAHYHEPLSLDSLAERFFVSKYHLSHTFTATVGTSVYRYIVLKRLLMAKQMLLEGQSPGSVSRNCGFPDYASFYRAFRAEYGAGPKEFLGRADS